MITIYQKTIREKEFKVLDSFKIGSWVCVEDPSGGEIDTLVADYKLERSYLEDALDPYEVPHLELVNDFVYIYTRVPIKNQQRITTYPLLFVVGPTFLLSLTKYEMPFLRALPVKNPKDYSTTQKLKMLIKLFDEINLTYNNFLIEINRRVRNASSKLEKIENKDIIQFVSFENILNDFLSALVPTSAVLNNLLSGKHLKLYDNDKDLIEDHFVDNNQLILLCRSTLKTIVNVREAYSTIMTHNLNQVIKLFTSVTVVLTIPMVIASFYGMNVSLPLAQSPNAFWLILFLALGVALGALLVFIHKKWL